ncbi:MAG: PaaI family thioesterase [Pseudomonadota bacterium]
MANKGVDIEGMNRLLDTVFAPMIQALNIEPRTISDQGVGFFVPDNAFMMRAGDIVCGQAIASIADTVGVLTLFAHNPTERFMSTVDMTTHFMRPLFNGGLQVDTTILSNGRRMATVSVDVRQHGSEKLAAKTTCAYAYVDAP